MHGVPRLNGVTIFGWIHERHQGNSSTASLKHKCFTGKPVLTSAFAGYCYYFFIKGYLAEEDDDARLLRGTDFKAEREGDKRRNGSM